MLTKEQKEVVVDVIKSDRTYDEINWDLGFDPSDCNGLLLLLLENAAASGNAEHAEEALALSFSILETNHEFLTLSTPALIKILAFQNHYKHEDIVRLLQKAQDSRTVDALYNAALTIPSYQRRYDEGAALARKCTWALADIGNEAAYYKLKLLTAHPNLEIAGYAQRRIDLWQEELSRKFFQFLP